MNEKFSLCLEIDLKGSWILEIYSPDQDLFTPFKIVSPTERLDMDCQMGCLNNKINHSKYLVFILHTLEKDGGYKTGAKRCVYKPLHELCDKQKQHKFNVGPMNIKSICKDFSVIFDDNYFYETNKKVKLFATIGYLNEKSLFNSMFGRGYLSYDQAVEMVKIMPSTKIKSGNFFQNILNFGGIFKKKLQKSLSKDTYECYKEYMKWPERLNISLMNSMELTNQWHIIYYYLYMGETIPITCAILDRNRVTNERFWVNMYKMLLAVYKVNGLKFDIKKSWPSLFTMINALAHNYVFEEEDIYHPSWISRNCDCDESFMAYVLFTMFEKCKFTNEYEESKDLLFIQKYSSNYIPFYAFYYVTSPSAGMQSEREPQNPIGHMTLQFISKKYFEEHCIKTKSFKPEKWNPVEDDEPFYWLFAETTAMIAPTCDQIPKQKVSVIKKAKVLNPLHNQNFYTHLNILYTTKYLKEGIIGFFGGIQEIGRKPKYRIPIRYILSKQYGDKEGLDKKIRFYPIDKIDNNTLQYIIDCSKRCTFTPNLIVNEKWEHVPYYITNENYSNIENDISNFLSNVLNITKDEIKKPSTSIILSMDDLMNNTTRQDIEKNYSGRMANIKRFEPIYKNYVYIIELI